MRLATVKVLATVLLASLFARPALAQNDVFGQILQGFAQGMQQAQQNQGYNNPYQGSGNRYQGQQNNQFRSSGNWFDTTPNYRYENRPRYKYVGGVEVSTDPRTGKTTSSNSFSNRVLDGYDRVRVRDGSTTTANVGNILTDVFNAAGTAAANSNYQDAGYRDRRPYNPGPQQYYQQPSRPQQTYVRPQPVATARPALPVKNVVRPVKRQPKANDTARHQKFEASLMSAEFDARQSNELSKGGGKIDASLEDEVSEKATAGTAPPGMDQALAEAVTSGDPEKYKEFKDKFGKDLSPERQKQLDTRIAMLEYEQELASGLLTEAGKDQRLQEINDQIAGWGPSKLRDSVQGNVSEMEKFNELGKLSDLAQGSENPWGVMMEGTQSAGYPVSFLAEVSGVPIMSEPLVDSAASGAATTVLLNPEANGKPVNYSLGPHRYTMQPGESQRLDKSYLIAFHPGQGGAVKTYRLGTGTYRFVHRDGSWELQTWKVKVTIDNSQYDGAFNYLVDGKDAVLQSGQAADLTSELPIVIEFDRGDGGKPARKVLSEGTYLVGVDAAEQRLDLFDAEDQSGLTVASDTDAGSGSDSTVAVSATGKAKHNGADRARQIQEALARLKAKN